ncbi:DUF805 domain-containing protein [Erwinia amylovora]|uniref:DUF805 domain-containing protein n=1 Tax=Erwinia amylovora TaxID=552 RepID=UPI000C06AB42|nr:DUF805 domain-containing protein [Erwinia amylovora]
MTLQKWCFSYRGRLRRRDFWIWQCCWLLMLVLLFTLAGNGLLETQTAAFCVVALLWPTSAVLVKRLHDRNKGGHWALLVEIGGLAGTPSDNRFGKPAQSVNFLRRRMADYQ